MKAGRMRSMIEVWEPKAVKDEYGATTISWESRGRWRAERTSLSGRRVVEASEQFADYTVRYNVRIQHKVAPGWQVDGDDGLRYEIVSVEPYKWLGMQTLVCERVNL